MSLLLSIIPVGELHTLSPIDRRAVYLTSNGVHVDFVLPVKDPWFDWTEYISLKKDKLQYSENSYLGFGWGEKNFYLETQEFSDLTFTNAFKALFLDSPSVIHLTVFKKEPIVREHTKRIFLDREQYSKLTNFILNSFAKPEMIEAVPCCPYYVGYDQFYPAKKSYSLFYTCNTWVVEGMQEIGAKTALWSPWPFGILYHLP